MTPRFILAKYVPDLGRMEPRNIGVFVWWKGAICAKFLDAEDVSGLNDSDTYERWKTYWSKLVDSDAIRPKRGKPVSKKDPACLDALITTQKGNYLLVDSGELMKKVKKHELPQVTQFLFDDLVATPQPSTPSAQSKNLAKQCETVVEKSGITKRSDYKPQFQVECPIYGVNRHFRVTYGIGNGTADALFQRVPLSQTHRVNSSALMFHSLVEGAIIPRERCAALVQMSDINGSTAEEGFEFLSKTCHVIDVDQQREATESVNAISESNGHA